MDEIGPTLREARERLGLTLDEVERAIRIRSHHLERLERSDFAGLPSPVQARGFLRNYAEYLGLDTEALLLSYAEGLQARGKRSRDTTPLAEAATRPSVQILSRRPRWLSTDLLVAGGIALAVVTVLVWGGNRLMASLRARTEAAEERSSLFIPAPTDTPAAAPTEESTPADPQAPAAIEPVLGPTATAPDQPPALSGGAVSLRLLAERRVWIRLLADGRVVFTGRMAPGDFVEAQAQEVIEVTAGNGGALRVFFNGQDAGLLGSASQVVVMLWTIEGAVTPTPSPTVPPTETSEAPQPPPPTP